MKVLVACEFSGIVREAFRRKGHDAWSCDLLKAEDNSEFHLKQDVIEALTMQEWDLIIAHPPCTYLTYAGACYWNSPERIALREEALNFFLRLYNCKCTKVAIENPRGWPCHTFRKPDQEINPFNFGQPIRKRICLWLRGLPKLVPTENVEVKPSGSCIKSNGRVYNYYFHQGKNSHNRSRFFTGVADAMADQWGRDNSFEYCANLEKKRLDDLFSFFK